MAKGMAGKSPQNQQTTTQTESQQQLRVNPRTGRPFKFSVNQLLAKQAAGEQLGPKQIARLQKAGKIAPSPVTPTPQLSPQQIEQRVGTAAGTGVEQFLNLIGQQGAFQPGSFAEQMNTARQNIMQQFEATQAPEFARQQAEFNQMAAERGLDPNSQAYKTLQQQLTQRQDAARQGAMLAAEQAAQQVQAQGFGQALQGYQAPAAMLGAYAPFYEQFGRRLTEQEQQQLAKEKLAQDWRTSQLQAQTSLGTARIGQYGQLSPEQQLQMMREKYGLEAGLAMLPGAQPRQPSTGSTVASGLAQGIGAGVAGWLGGK